MTIYTKHGRKVFADTIRIDTDCYIGDRVFKIRAVVQGARNPRLLYITDLLADDGRQEILETIKTLLAKG